MSVVVTVSDEMMVFVLVTSITEVSVTVWVVDSRMITG